ncbi:uncharacterized protein BO97DRAFT_109566 [Aspergillus homomorphus CBS 101889]|uniref:Uncharacterized protein n=1 Tax=Aspergillus homomorphus (strain CBS 101889) TaxID=1450537 RepID=A0A395HUC0_ASPHC|nr:hypothetical protein BO97DRAFT_109566 [Aspergillus homomorphus CBS 101889]RAL10985.1 hypothetical protein BO97DRAFT_109566 [Aspergillus homomorphus CBS 101889]
MVIEISFRRCCYCAVLCCTVPEDAICHATSIFFLVRMAITVTRPLECWSGSVSRDVCVCVCVCV